MTSRTSAFLLFAVLACTPSEPPRTPVAPPKAPERAATPPAIEKPEAPEPVRTVVAEAFILRVDGKATVQREGSDERVELKIGDAIRQGDVIRTEKGATLEIGAAGRSVALDEGSSLRLSILGAKRIRVDVTGNATATSGGEGDIELAADGSDAVATVAMGKVMLVSDGRGGAGLTTMEGTARFSGGGREQTLQSGELSTLGAAKIPSRPVRIPRKISLRVEWPEGGVTNRTPFVVRGVASATARVWVQGKRVETGADGAFESPVPLGRSKQQVTVLAVDALGRRTTQRKELLLDPDAPSIKGAVQYR